MIDVAKRLRLAELLSEAAELEHGLMCQYLFAAFALKRSHDEGVTWPQLEQMRRWEASIMLVARQEMEHLGLVNNILTAIGEAPYFDRPNFPLGARHYPIHIPFKLERLTIESVRRFVEFEMPRTLDDAERAQLEQIGVAPGRFETIGQLYDEILALLTELDSPQLWIGPPSAQFVTNEIVPVPLRGISLPPTAAFYDIKLEAVTDLPSATVVIAQILEEGEGAPTPSPTSHFARFAAETSGLSDAGRKTGCRFIAR